jgi:predicted nucleic acid-binding protein
MDLIYLDHNCFQRSFDDHRQIRIQMEALACQEIFNRAEREELRLVWSFMHQDENLLCPFPERKIEVFRLSSLCEVRVGTNDDIYRYALSFQQKGRLSAKDAIHVACAFYAKATFFITCDDRLIRRARRLNLNMKLMNPVDYIQ